MKEQLTELRVEELRSFRGHPFQVKDDEAMDALCESIALYGVLSPLLARPVGEGYEIISGHRRRAAALRLGLDKLPVLVRDMTDDEAVILMVDSNIQRENLLPSEKAFAYKMKLEAMKHQAGRPLKNSPQVASNYRSDDALAEQTGVSGDTIRRYIRLTNLAKPLLDMVDEQKIALSPAVELSYLTKQEQAELWDLMQSEYCTPSLSQAVRMKKLSQKEELTPEAIFNIMSEEKANQRERVRIDVSAIRKYFPRSYTARQMEETILKLLEAQYRKRQRDRGR
jgi:ParB family chromosome partitioning protein